MGDDLFVVDPGRGIVTTRGNIDRESRSMYTIPIYVTEASTLNDLPTNFGYSKANKNIAAATTAAVTATTGATTTTPLFDVATIFIKITDKNDHAPQFPPGICYPLAVPENHEAAIIHTVVATDFDEGQNGDIIYTITGKRPNFLLFLFSLARQSFALTLQMFLCLFAGGNFGNKFSIDMHTGELTAKPLDRESVSRYHLQITAQDRGSPITYQSTCNISITVEDQNDSTPRFDWIVKNGLCLQDSLYSNLKKKEQCNSRCAHFFFVCCRTYQVHGDCSGRCCDRHGNFNSQSHRCRYRHEFTDCLFIGQ